MFEPLTEQTQNIKQMQVRKGKKQGYTVLQKRNPNGRQPV